jgi:6-phosphofructokinase 1
LSKTIDNDVAMTDVSFGFDTAMGIAAEAIDRLHSTAHSHHRIIVLEIMGHQSGWLALGAGVSGGADVILIPEIPYDISKVADSILTRVKNGSNFSIIAVAEGAVSKQAFYKANDYKDKIKKCDDCDNLAKLKRTKETTGPQLAYHLLARQLEELTRLESRDNSGASAAWRHTVSGRHVGNQTWDCLRISSKIAYSG